jgi:23S rRNA (uracil1939-C5)-methyltransferase
MARIFKPSSAKKQYSNDKVPSRLLIESLSLEAKGVAKHQGKTVFVDGGLPGEEVSISHYTRSKRYSECQVKSVLVASAERVTPACPHDKECGGCQLQHLLSSQQVTHKQQTVVNNLIRQLGTDDFQVLEPILSTEQYRERARMVISAQAQLCFREKNSDNLIPINHCLILNSSLQPLYLVVQQWLAGLPKKSGVTHVEFIAGQPSVAVVVRHVRLIDHEQTQLLHKICAEIDAQVWFQADKGGSLIDSAGIACDPRLYYELPEYELKIRFHPSDFTQVNHAVNVQMVDQALQWLQLDDTDTVLDLFCGVGNFTLPMAKYAAEVIGVEGVTNMVERGKENAEFNGIGNATFKSQNLDDKELGNTLKRFSANKFLLDPPRSGAQHVCEQMANSGVQKGVYISCNPASFIRDAKILQEQGYQLKYLRVLDMFLHTSHIETMALFERAERPKKGRVNQW